MASMAAADIDAVICVPWHGNPLSHHTAIGDQAVRLKGVIRTTTTATIWYRWVYGDGDESAVGTLSGSTVYNVEANHAYTGAVGTPFTAQLQADSVDGSMANAVSDNYPLKIEQNNLDAQVNIAIDDGLWHLFKSKWTNSYTYRLASLPADAPLWVMSDYSNYYAGPTAAAVQAFLINNHREDGDPAEDPYVECVQGGLNWLLHGYYRYGDRYMLRPFNIGVDGPSGATFDPDMNGNGKGIDAYDYSHNVCYQGGMIMDALIATGTPEKDTGRDFDGDGSTDSYRDVVQDMCDAYAWGQYDSTTHGGWRYGWEQGPDNSACQWAAIGMIPAETEPGWNCQLPAKMKEYNNNWLSTSFHEANRWFGYTGTGAGNDSSWACRPSGMVQMVMSTPDYKTDNRWTKCESWFADNWATFLSHRTYYGWYAFVKAMRLSDTETLSSGFNWYRGSGGMAQKLVADQETDGSWPSTGQTTHPGNYGNTFVTAWAIGMLKAELFSAAPIASFTANPNPTYSDWDITFDPSSSGHSETGKSIEDLVEFSWDWDNDGIYDETFDSPVVVVHVFHAEPEEMPKTFPVTLKVRDDEDLVATYTLDVSISNPPHPPVADADGPYVVSLCPCDSLTLDGSGSYDPNEGTHEAGAPQGTPDDTITAWGWDLTPPLTGFDDESGETVELDATAVAGYWTTVGRHDIGLQVTDNTLLSFPSSGSPNLTAADFSSVNVFAALDPCVINSGIGCHSVLLTWATAGQFEVWRSTEGKNIGFLKIGDADGTSYNDADTDAGGDVTEGGIYWYRLLRPNEIQMSCWTSIEYHFDFTKCVLVTDLAATGKTDEVTLLWTGVPGTDAYNVYRSENPDVACVPGNRIASGVGIPESRYLDTAVVNGTRYYYRVSGVAAGQEEFISNEADATPPEPPPEMTCTVATDHDWTFQNTDTVTQWRNQCVLTITLDDPLGTPETFYAVSVRADAASEGSVVIEPTGDPFVLNIKGSRYGTAEIGEVILNVVVRTLLGRRVCTASTTVDVRPLGDVTGDGCVTGQDKQYMNQRLNNAAVPHDDRHYDFNGDDSVGGADKNVMNIVLNNGSVP